MAKIIKALVIEGRYKGETVRVSNVSLDELGRKSAACILANGTRANIKVSELEVIPDAPEPEPEVRHAKTSSMPFVGGSSSSRTLTHTKNMSKPRMEKKAVIPSTRHTDAICESCGAHYNLEDRKGKAGKLTDCEACAVETEKLMEGKMIFSHKTGATIEIKKDGELKHEAEIFKSK